MEHDSFISWTDRHTRHTGKAIPNLKTFLFHRNEKGSPYALLTEGITDKFDIVTALIQAPKKEKATNPTYIYI